MEADIKQAKERSLLMLQDEDTTNFNEWFDSEGYLDVVENINDYLAEGIVSFYYQQKK